MHLISRAPLRLFWQQHPDLEGVLKAWCKSVERADWASPTDIQMSYTNARMISGERVIFNIKGNSYRLVVRVDYQFKKVYVRFIGTHAEYDRINSLEV